MKKFKLFVLLCISFCLVAVASIGVYAAFNKSSYTLEGSLEFDVDADTLVDISTAVYKAKAPQTTDEIYKTIEKINVNNKIPDDLSVVTSETLIYDNGIAKDHTQSFSLNYDKELISYYVVVKIENVYPVDTVWAIVDDNMNIPDNITMDSNLVANSINKKTGFIVYSLNLNYMSANLSDKFYSKLKIGTGFLDEQPFVTKKLRTDDDGKIYAANKNISGIVYLRYGTLGSGAFKDCPNITRIVIEGNVYLSGIDNLAIGVAPFDNCANLEYLRVNGINSEMSTYFASNCPKLRYLHLRNISGTMIPAYTFQNASKLFSTYITAGITRIDHSAFDGCESLKNVYISDLEQWLNIEFDSQNTPFEYAENLYLNEELVTKIEIPESITEIGDYAFFNCKNLKEVTIHDNVTSIGANAFSGCSNLEKININQSSSSLNSIGESAFENCSKLKSIDIPNSVTTIGKYSFDSCSNLQTVSITENSKINSIEIGAFRSCSSLTSFTIPDGVQSLKQTFSNCISLKTINIPQSVNSIANGAFSGCTTLERVDITSLTSWLNIVFADASDNPIYLARRLFENDVEVKDITINSSTLNKFVFYNCDSIENITITSSVTEVQDYAFTGCMNLKTATFANDSALQTVGVSLFSGCSSLESVNLPTQLTSLPARMFNNCMNLKTVDIPEQVNLIGTKTFYSCKELTSINIPALVTSIGATTDSNGVFENCSKLKTVTFNDNANLVTLGAYCFKNCASLITINLEANTALTTIGKEAFNLCSSLMSITMPASVQSSGNFGCTKLVHVRNLSSSVAQNVFGTKSDLEYVTTQDATFNNTLAINGNYYTYEFNGYKYVLGLIDTSVTVINDLDTYSITAIYTNAFQGCVELTEITIPATVAIIKEDAFLGCSKLVRIKDLRTWPSNPHENTDGVYTNQDFPDTHLLRTEGEKYLTYTVKDAEGNVTIKYLMGLADTSVTEINDLDQYGITSIYKYAFYENKTLQSITIPASVTKINSHAFYGCLLKTINFADNSQLLEVGDYAFAYTRFEEIVLPQSLSTIGEHVFAYSNIRNINIPNSIETMGSSVFEECKNINIVRFDDNSKLELLEQKSFYNSFIREIYFGDNSALETIYTDAFYGCEKLSVVEFGENTKVSTIRERAFDLCKSLTEFDMPLTLTRLYSAAFAYTNLKSVYIPNLTYWESGSFEFCTNLKSVTFSEDFSLTKIPDFSFQDCGIINIQIPDCVDTLGQGVFRDSNIQNIILKNVKSIGDGAFYNCLNLRSVEFYSNELTTIPNIFSLCSGLKKIVLPESVTKINNYALHYPTDLVIYYSGTQEEFSNVSYVSDYNQSIKSSNIIYEYGWSFVRVVTEPTCTAEGSNEYVNICGRTREFVVPKIQHNFVDGVCSSCSNSSKLTIVETVGDYGFIKDSTGIYVSNNRNVDSSTAKATITATESVTITLKIVVDTEYGYDKLTVLLNGNSITGLNSVSGYLEITKQLTLSVNDVITISYVKDSNSNTVEDSVKFGILS